MLHHQRWYYLGPYCEGTRGILGSKQIDAQADARRSSKRDTFAKPPQDRIAHFHSHATDAAPTESMLSNTSCLTKICAESVSRSVTQPKGATFSFTVIRDLRGERGVVEQNDAEREGSTPGATSKPSRLLSPARQKNRTKTPKEDLGKHCLLYTSPSPRD